MTPKSREILYEKMLALRSDKTIDFAVAFSSSRYIDTYGIVPAIRSALARALDQLVEVKPQQAERALNSVEVKPREVEILLDGGLHAPEAFVHQRTIIRGDQIEPVISLASIAAKVERDRMMVKLAARYPAYGFEIHKGYGTAAHRRAILASGFSEIHRRSFCTRLSTEV